MKDYAKGKAEDCIRAFATTLGSEVVAFVDYPAYIKSGAV